MWSEHREIDRAHSLLGSYSQVSQVRVCVNDDVATLTYSRRLLSVVKSIMFSGRLKKRTESFERDYPALLLSLASGVRTGLDPFVALCKCGELFSCDSEMKHELERLRKVIDSGATEERAIQEFASSLPHPDLPLFRSAFMLARKEGSSLAETLQRLARVTRQRQSFRRKIRSAIAMQKLSAIGISLCAIVIGLIQGVTNPDAFRAAWQNPIGSRALIAGLALVTLGLGWMLSLARSRI